jgi:hypothetical protein
VKNEEVNALSGVDCISCLTIALDVLQVEGSNLELHGALKL